MSRKCHNSIQSGLSKLKFINVMESLGGHLVPEIKNCRQIGTNT